MGSLILAALVATAPLSPDAGIAPDDRPLVLKTGAGYLFNEPAFNAVDAEMKRLQKAEQAAKAAKQGDPPWFEVVLVSALVGLAVGVPTGYFLGRLR